MSLFDISTTRSQEPTTKVCKTCHRTVVAILVASMLRLRTKSDDSLEPNSSANSEPIPTLKKLQLANESLDSNDS